MPPSNDDARAQGRAEAAYRDHCFKTGESRQRRPSPALGLMTRLLAQDESGRLLVEFAAAYADEMQRRDYSVTIDDVQKRLDANSVDFRISDHIRPGDVGKAAKLAAFIARDGYGFGGRVHFTHSPSGRTFVRQPFMDDEAFNEGIAEWMKGYEGLSIHDCPRGPYVATSENHLCTVAAFLEDLQNAARQPPTP